LLIGRSYSAAIERRKTKKAEEENDDFYLQRVAPQIMKSQMDAWLSEARSVNSGTDAALRTLVDVHGHTTQLCRFRLSSGLI
jgi:hypothetical protein